MQDAGPPMYGPFLDVEQAPNEVTGQQLFNISIANSLLRHAFCFYIHHVCPIMLSPLILIFLQRVITIHM